MRTKPLITKERKETEKRRRKERERALIYTHIAGWGLCRWSVWRNWKGKGRWNHSARLSTNQDPPCSARWWSAPSQRATRHRSEPCSRTCRSPGTLNTQTPHILTSNSNEFQHKQLINDRIVITKMLQKHWRLASDTSRSQVARPGRGDWFFSFPHWLPMSIFHKPTNPPDTNERRLKIKPCEGTVL